MTLPITRIYNTEWLDYCCCCYHRVVIVVVVIIIIIIIIIIIANKLQKTHKEAVRTYFQVPLRHFSRVTENNHE
jgi:uncharacterized membrane protein